MTPAVILSLITRLAPTIIIIANDIPVNVSTVGSIRLENFEALS